MAAPLRTCLVCREKREKEDLFYMIYDKSEKILHKKTAENYKGRGMYICLEAECIEKFIKKTIQKLRKQGFKLDEDLKNELEENLK